MREVALLIGDAIEILLRFILFACAMTVAGILMYILLEISTLHLEYMEDDEEKL